MSSTGSDTPGEIGALAVWKQIVKLRSGNQELRRDVRPVLHVHGRENGSFYGPESPQTLEQLRYARMGIAAFPGPADAYLSQIWIQDAGGAVVAALTQVPSGIYDIVDDEPLTRSELFKAMAQSVGRRRLLRLPGPLMRLMTGVAADMLNRSQRVSNRCFKELTGWQPSVPDARAGWQLIAEATRTSGTPRETARTSHA